MSAPVTIGDVVLMGQIAWKLAQALTKGRKSAPSQFREVENQLYSLSSALKSLSEAQNPDGSPRAGGPGAGHDWDAVQSILENCGQTLGHLESVIEKYGDIVEPQDPTRPRFKKWRRGLYKNWKKVAWTTESGHLATLRSQLVVHTSSLNIIIGVINNTQATRIETGMQETSTMLKDIHTWYIDNLKDVETIPRSSNGSPASGMDVDEAQFTVESITFQLAGRTLTRNWVNDIQFSYDTATNSDSSQHLSSAEMMISYGDCDEGSTDVAQTAIILKHDTITSLDMEDFVTKVAGVEVIGIFLDGRTLKLPNSDVTIEFTQEDAARRFYAKVNNAREELFVSSLKYPREDESTLLVLQSAQVKCDEIFIQDASITVVRASGRKHRLIIVSSDNCTILSQDLVDDSLSSLSGKLNLALPVWLIELQRTGARRISYRKNGLQHLSFSSAQSSRMFQLGCSAMSMNDTGNHLIMDDSGDPQTPIPE